MGAIEDLEGLILTWEDRLTRQCSLAEASESIGWNETFLSKSKGLSRGPRALDLLESLHEVGDPLPSDVFHDAFPLLGVDPALKLACAREYQGLPPDRFLKTVAPRLRQLAQDGPTPESGRWQRRRAKIAALDELRKRDWPLAKTRLQEMISWALSRLEERGDRPKAALGDVSYALGVLAAILRLTGHRDAATDALLLARPLALLAEDHWVLGQWYQKTIYLLVDLKRYDRPYEFAHEALKCFVFAGSLAGQAGALIEIGYVQNHASLHREALDTLQAALPLIPNTERHLQFGVHHLIALQLGNLDDVPGALKHLEKAIEMAGEDQLALAAAYWGRARLAMKMGASALAFQSFEAAIPLYVKQAGTGELAEIALDYASLLLKENRRPELKTLAADVSGWIHKLKANRKLRDLIADFAALEALGHLDLPAIEMLQLRFKAAQSKKPKKRKSRKAAQPLGG